MSGFAGAVLTGGASRRMGQDKALLPIAGSPLAAMVASVVQAAGGDPVVAIGGNEPALTAIGLEVVPDRWPGEGPLGGLLSALRWSPAARVAVVACDMPWLDVATIRELAATDPAASEVVMAFSDRLEPLCAIWDVEHCAPALQAAFDSGERSVRRAIRGLRVRRVELADPGPVRDVDAPGDLPGPDLRG